jgi:hypothetical protein
MQKPVFLVLTNICNLLEKKRLENVQTSVGLEYWLNLGINLDINKSMLVPYQSFFFFDDTMVDTQLTWYLTAAISQHIPYPTGQDATPTTINTHTLEYLKLTS